MIIRLENVTLRRGPNKLLDNCSFVMQKGDHIGLIGANGVGKTSLLGLFSRTLELDSGELTIARGLRIAHMEQEMPGSGKTAVEFVLDGDSELRRLQAALATAEQEGRQDSLAIIHEQLEIAGAYDANSRAESILSGLGFSETDLVLPYSHFSGGWRIRLNLARVLFCPADLLLLDEPTNHLDLDATIWLEDWLNKYQGAILLISHDRHFLDKTVKQVARIESQQLKTFRGNYSDYEQQRSEELSQQQALFEKQQRRKKEIEAFVTRFRAKASKARQAQSRLKELNRMEQIAAANINSPFAFKISTEGKLSDPLIKLRDVAVGYDNTRILENVQLSISPGDRIGILGRNGAGKTTLLKSLAGELELLDGEKTEGLHLSSAYFAQHQVEELDLAASPYLHLLRNSKNATDQEIRNFLGGFNFRGERVDERVGIFSGGEKARLALAIIAWKKPNLLFMDEPTNHLDMEMRQSLIFALQEYQGALVMISHDRHLLSSCVNEFWLVEDGKLASYEGDLEEYQRALIQVKQGANRANGTRNSKRKRQEQAEARKKLSPLKKKLALLENEIKTVRATLVGIENELGEPGIYGAERKSELQQMLKEQGRLQVEVEEKELAWFRTQEELDRLALEIEENINEK